MNDTNPSLELSEVAARFSESERLLQDARDRLHAILQNERRSQEAADSLTDSAQAVSEFTARADRVLEEAGAAVAVAREVLETGRNLISGNAIGAVDKRVATALDEVQKLQTLEAETLAAVNADAQARGQSQESNERTIADLQARVAEADKRVATALDEVQKLQTLEAETLAAVNADAQARGQSQESNERTLADLQARVAEADKRVATALDEVQKLQTLEAETLAAVNADAQARGQSQESNERTLADLQARVAEADKRVATALDEVQKLQTLEAETLAAVNADAQARGQAQESNEQLIAEVREKIAEVALSVKSNRIALWLALGALLVGQVVVAILAVLV